MITDVFLFEKTNIQMFLEIPRRFSHTVSILNHAASTLIGNSAGVWSKPSWHSSHVSHDVSVSFKLTQLHPKGSHPVEACPNCRSQGKEATPAV